MQKSLQELRDEITCPVCQEFFQDPKILPCGHYYCKRCVLQLAAREQPFPCPECRGDTRLPPTGADGFPPAFFVNRLKSLYSSMEKVQHGATSESVLTVPQAPSPNYPVIVSRDPLETDRFSVKLQKRFSSGQLDELWLGVWKRDTHVTVKSLKRGTVRRVAFLQDVDVMKKLRHPNLIELYAICTKEEPFFIITELMFHGSLFQYLRADWKLPHLIDMSVQVAAGMAYLEEKKYIHRDLNTRNILVARGLKYKISTFGISPVNDAGIYEIDGTILILTKWMAPETLEHSRFTIKSNVWSFGIVLYEIITLGRLPPYLGITNDEVKQRIKQGYRMPCPLGCPEKLYDIMMDTWQEEPENRPDFKTLQRRLNSFF